MEMETTGLRKRIKREPADPDEPLLQIKYAASPAQEATRARIASIEAQLRTLYAETDPHPEDAFRIRCLEEDLRKAHSKLRRLLNEAERQRRRRERLRNLSPSSSMDRKSIMSSLRGCNKFEDFTRELHSLGFVLSRLDNAPEATETKVEDVPFQVELVEGEALEDDAKTDSSSSEDIASSNERDWWARQLQLRRQWEEKMMHQQLEWAKSTLESITTTFLEGIHHVMQQLTNRQECNDSER